MCATGTGLTVSGSRRPCQRSGTPLRPRERTLQAPDRRTPPQKIASAEPCSSHSLRRPAQHRGGTPRACDHAGCPDPRAPLADAAVLWPGEAPQRARRAHQRGEPFSDRDFGRNDRTRQRPAKAGRRAARVAATGTRPAAATTAAPAPRRFESRAASGAAERAAAIARDPQDTTSPARRRRLGTARYQTLHFLIFRGYRAGGNGTQWRAALRRRLVSRAAGRRASRIFVDRQRAGLGADRVPHSARLSSRGLCRAR